MAEPKFWCITSGKGGVGKTCLAVNLGFALAQQGKRVLLVDGDLGLANVDVLLNLEVRATMQDILDQDADPLKTVIPVNPWLSVLPASSGVPEMANLGPEDQAVLGEVLKTVAAPFDYVLVDTGAGLGQAVLWFNTLADYSLVVVTPDPTALTDAYALIKVLVQHYQYYHFQVILNSVQGEQEASKTFETLAQAASKFLNLHLDYLGSVPADPAVKKALRTQGSFLEQFPQSEASLAVKTIAGRMARLSQQLSLSENPDSEVQAV
jgi:flagellar biosynthesis protein FlhG